MSQTRQRSRPPGNDGVPKPLQSNKLTARVIRQKLWRQANVLNDWGVFVIVGREGSGKSMTCASILEKCDPSFAPENVHFDPVEFLEDIESDSDRTGEAAMLDESGVGLGNRTWYDRGQIEFNQAMQTARDDNMIIGLTLPRLEELDLQMKGRLHGFLEMTDKDPGNWAEFKWLDVDPSRDGTNKIYKKFPRMNVGGGTKRVTRLRMGPPTEEFIEGYEAKKAEFKRELYEQARETLEEDRGDGEDGPTVHEIADEIKEEGVEEYVSIHGGNGTQYVDAELIEMDYELSKRDAKKVKKLLDRDDEVVLG